MLQAAEVLHQSLVSCWISCLSTRCCNCTNAFLWQRLLPCCADAGQDAGISDGSCDMLPDSLLLHIFSCMQSPELCR